MQLVCMGDEFDRGSCLESPLVDLRLLCRPPLCHPTNRNKLGACQSSLGGARHHAGADGAGQGCERGAP